MAKQFLKVKEVQLVNGGYLSNMDSKPVYNEAFVNQQRHAEYIVTFAKLCEGKNFKEVKVDNVDSIREEVLKMMNDKSAVVHVKGPKAIKQPTTEALKDEAMAFIDFGKDKSKADKINNFLVQFGTMHEFEEHGLFFDEDIVKLNALYTMKQVIAAVTKVIDLV